MSIDYAVVTYGAEGIGRVARMIPPPAEGVRYVVSWQNHADAPLPPGLLRDDVTVARTSTRGISLNRNNALSRCTADIVVFADDDLILYPEAPDVIRHAYGSHPDAQVITFRSEHGDPARFPRESVPLGKRLPKGYSAASFEITMTREAARRLRCCPEMGVGAPLLHGGEDELILWTAIRNGLPARFVPETICAHPHPSTGTKETMSAGNMQAAGCLVAMMYPFTAPLRLPLRIWRIWRSGRSPLLPAVRHILTGALRAPGLYLRHRDIFNARPT